jgi:hypothetical protein
MKYLQALSAAPLRPGPALLFGVSLLAMASPGRADEPATRYGSVTQRGVGVEGGFTASALHANDFHLADEALLSFDLVATLPAGRGQWTLYVEASSSVKSDAVSSRVAEANADAATAVDGDDRGRLQVSELHYSLPLGGDRMILGLLNPAGFLDASEIANDESNQFLAASFVNNPTIAFPDYTLGAAYHHDAQGGIPGYTLLLASSHGLADNAGRSYAELVAVDADGKGLFAAVELYWLRGATILRLGLWQRSDAQARLSGSGEESNYGLYGVADGSLGQGRWNLRLGLANDAVSEAANFAAVALEQPLAGHTLGLGLAHTGASNRLGPEGGDRLHAETYLRIDLNDALHLTPSLQFIRHGGLDQSARALWLAALRASYAF